MTTQRLYVPTESMIVRVPLMPVGAVGCGSGVSSANRVVGRAWLEQALADPIVREALYLASPGLLAAEEYWRKDPESKKGSRFEKAVVRYLFRMSTRSTPFGLFAGVAPAGLASDGDGLVVGDARQHRRSTRLDMDFLCQVCLYLAQDPQVRDRIRFRTNDSVHIVGDKCVYSVQDVNEDSRTRTYRLRADIATDAVKRVVEFAKRPARLSEIAQIFAADGDDDPALAKQFVERMASLQMLRAELWPVVTGEDPLGEIIGQLEEAGCAEVVEVLRRVQRMLADIDADGLGLEPSRYESLAAVLQEAFPFKISIDRLFQVDMETCVTGSVSLPELEDVSEALEVLHRLEPGTSFQPLAEFKKAFIQRYEGRALPLLDVLDEEFGIGPNGVREGDLFSEILVGVRGYAGKGEPTHTGDSQSAFKMEQLLLSANRGFAPIRLRLEQVERGVPFRNLEPLPPSVVVMGEPTSQGFFLKNCSKGTSLIGRFAYLDRKIQGWMEDLIAKEQDGLAPGCYFAQVVHHPGGRIGNVLLKPGVREREIVFLGRTTSPIEKQVDVSNLLVSISGDRVVVQDRRNGDELIPLLDNAHAVRPNEHAVYRFLQAVGAQYQDVGLGLGWSWGSLGQLGHLPRVSVGRVVVSLEMWNIENKDKGPRDGWTAASVAHWGAALKDTYKLPRLVVLVHGDNKLVVDFENPLSVATLCAVTSSQKVLRFCEWIGPSDGVMTTDGQSLKAEMLIPFRCEEKGRAEDPGLGTPRGRTSFVGDEVRRQFSPGSEWLYAKIYAPPSIIDCLVVDELPRLVDCAREAGIDRWFYLRYRDEYDEHLRVRFHSKCAAGISATLNLLNDALKPYLDGGMVSRIAYDTYERELERYGLHPGWMQLTERMFEADSDMVCRLLSTCPPAERWCIGARSVVWYLELFGIDFIDQLEFIRLNKDAYCMEFGITGPDRQRSLNEFCRRHRGVGLFPPATQSQESIEAIYSEFSATISAIAHEFKGGQRAELLRWLQSFLHMHMNRLYYSNQRRYEAATYYYLWKAYESMNARWTRESMSRLPRRSDTKV